MMARIESKKLRQLIDSKLTKKVSIKQQNDLLLPQSLHYGKQIKINSLRLRLDDRI